MITTTDMSFEAAGVMCSYLNVKDSMYAMWCLLHDLGVEPANPEKLLRYGLMTNFTEICLRVYGIKDPQLLHGKPFEWVV